MKQIEILHVLGKLQEDIAYKINMQTKSHIADLKEIEDRINILMLEIVEEGEGLD